MRHIGICLLAALLVLGCDVLGPERTLWACGGTQTITPDGVIHCTGGLPPGRPAPGH